MKSKIRATYYPCGCLMSAMVVDERTTLAEYLRFRRTARRRGVTVRVVESVGTGLCHGDGCVGRFGARSVVAGPPGEDES